MEAALNRTYLAYLPPAPQWWRFALPWVIAVPVLGGLCNQILLFIRVLTQVVKVCWPQSRIHHQLVPASYNHPPLMRLPKSSLSVY